MATWLVVVLAFVGFCALSTVTEMLFDFDLARPAGALLGVAFIGAVAFFGGYGLYATISDKDPLHLGTNKPQPADQCDQAPAGAAVPGC
jgi:FtsH-binding integral membrane protein